MDGDWKMRMWSIQETGMMDVQLVHILVSESWSARVRLGFCQPVRWAHLCKAGCVPLCLCPASWSLGHPAGWFDGLAAVDVCAFRA
jgi:hypothetical protein